eukprot:6242602-Amphidinium_carterae.1
MADNLLKPVLNHWIQAQCSEHALYLFLTCNLTHASTSPGQPAQDTSMIMARPRSFQALSQDCSEKFRAKRESHIL